MTGLARAVRRARPDRVDGADPATVRRQLVAAYCRMLADRESEGAPSASPVATSTLNDAAGLPRRLRQTLDHLLAGDGEKQIAYKLGLSPHTVHVYVKALHKKFGVNSRSELLSRFIAAFPPSPASL